VSKNLLDINVLNAERMKICCQSSPECMETGAACVTSPRRVRLQTSLEAQPWRTLSLRDVKHVNELEPNAPRLLLVALRRLSLVLEEHRFSFSRRSWLISSMSTSSFSGSRSTIARSQSARHLCSVCPCIAPHVFRTRLPKFMAFGNVAKFHMRNRME